MSPERMCPKCSHAVPSEATECPACGVLLAKARRPAEPAGHSEGGVWRAGGLLVMRRGATMPPRCVRCGEIAATRQHKALLWHSPVVYLAMMLHALVYLPVALIALKRVEVDLPMCARHHRRRRRMIWTGSFLIVAAVALFVTAVWLRLHPAWLFATVWIFGAGLYTGLWELEIVEPKKIDDEYVWIDKVCRAYLDRLPEAPETVRATGPGAPRPPVDRPLLPGGAG